MVLAKEPAKELVVSSISARTFCKDGGDLAAAKDDIQLTEAKLQACSFRKGTRSCEPNFRLHAEADMDERNVVPQRLHQSLGNYL